VNTYELNKNTYNSLATQYQDRFMYWDGYHASYDLFCEFLPKRSLDVLEIGCGPGNVSKYLLQKRPDLNIFGIDFAPNMIALAKENNPKANYEVLDCRDISTLNQKFDAIFCGFCVPYIDRNATVQLIRDSAKLVNANSLFYLSTMEGDYNNSGLQGSATHSEKIFIYYYESWFLEQQLEENKFQILDIRRQNYVSPDGQEAVDLFIIAKKL